MKKPNKRTIGQIAECLVVKYYEARGWNIIQKNRTIRGGEIDCIVENDQIRCFIEVKVINTIDDLEGYIAYHKKRFLKRTIRYYNYAFPTMKYLRIDVVFVKQNRIVHTFENLTI